jgi:hypothetical protein
LKKGEVFLSWAWYFEDGRFAIFKLPGSKLLTPEFKTRAINAASSDLSF